MARVTPETNVSVQGVGSAVELDLEAIDDGYPERVAPADVVQRHKDLVARGRRLVARFNRAIKKGNAVLEADRVAAR